MTVHYIFFFSLLDILAGRRSWRTTQGAVLVNGASQPPNFRLISGYVVQVRMLLFLIRLPLFILFQNDIIMGTLTVRENLSFSASLRLPSNMTYKERKQRVEKVIQELGLTACADTKVCNIHPKILLFKTEQMKQWVLDYQIMLFWPVFYSCNHLCIDVFVFRLALSSSEVCRVVRENAQTLVWS